MTARRALDEIEAAHTAVGGTSPGRRYATQQINQAYAVVVSSQFQKYCRDLHSEAIDQITTFVSNPSIREILRVQLTSNRKLDSGNPNSGNLGSDFGRLGLDFWQDLYGRDPRNSLRRRQLDMLNKWRNAIAHQDFDPAELAGKTQIRLSDVRGWRKTCEALAEGFDLVIRDHLATILGRVPW
ncbi:MAG: hypothetical protein HY718_16715 [Planctomycetes bacterium]|nr:hypothetical protein [Planctomycetota bacterium]